MIISHKYKFIFIKAVKVAGSSVEMSLAKHCGADDIITKLGEYSNNSNYDNFERNSNGYYYHMTPLEIKNKIPNEIWNNYYKFTIVRNPWDRAISKYFWIKWRGKTKNNPSVKKPIWKKITKNIFNIKIYKNIFKIYTKLRGKEDISYLLKHFRSEWTNERFYFDKKGNPICDFYIRYENLEEDYRKVCEHLGIPYEKLPRLKTKQRTEKKHYSTYYDEKAKKRITKICKKEIKYFNYKFEEKNDNLS